MYGFSSKLGGVSFLLSIYWDSY